MTPPRSTPEAPGSILVSCEVASNPGPTPFFPVDPVGVGVRVRVGCVSYIYNSPISHSDNMTSPKRGGRPRLYDEPMDRTTVSAPRSLMQRARRLDVNLSEVFRAALRVAVGLEGEREDLETKARVMKTELALLEREIETRDDKEAKRDVMVAAFLDNHRLGYDDHLNANWLESRFGVLRAVALDVIAQARSKGGPEVR